MYAAQIVKYLNFLRFPALLLFLNFFYFNFSTTDVEQEYIGLRFTC